MKIRSGPRRALNAAGLRLKVLIMRKVLLASAISLALPLVSCIKDEAPNAEADILKCTFPGDIMTGASVDYYAPYSDELNAYPIDIEVARGTSVRSLALELELTSGATVVPESGSVQNFERRVRYTVTSEDGRWHRIYSIGVSFPSEAEIVTDFTFDNVKKTGGYYTFYEEAPGLNPITWASGNQGFAITAGNAPAEDYPTTMDPAGHTGNCLKLVTRTTGALGEKVGKPIAAGNIFLGRFEMLNALGDALSATKMGIPFMHKPLKVTGWYRYTPGEKFYDNGYDNNRKDNCVIYAIFYERNSELQYMTGHQAQDGWVHPNMVAYARANTAAVSDWTYFEMEFDYDRYGKAIDPDKLAAGGYNLSIIMSSSEEGDLFKGAPGSTLMVDDMKLEYE